MELDEDAEGQAGRRAEQRTSQQVEWQPSTQPAIEQERRERRAQARHVLDTSAAIYLIRTGSSLKGRILDLSLGGCRICTDERFSVGIHTRVETEFRLEGLPFRLSGVIQAIYGRCIMGIRFLDVSERKRNQLEKLMREMEAAEARGSGPLP
jgi:c-di-GMP-binding flagellar brake protein YcgR